MNKGSIPPIVLVLDVANQPRTNTHGTTNNVFPTFRSGDVATFVMPSQATNLLGVLLTGYYRFLDNQTEPLITRYTTVTPTVTSYCVGSANSGTVNFSPKIGHLGIFSTVTALRYLAAQKIDTQLTLALTSFIRSSARFHDDSFINGSPGTSLYPYFQDASIDPSNLLPFDEISSWKNFAMSLPLGSFQAGKSISLISSQGLQWDFQIARVYDGGHFAFSDKNYTVKDYPETIFPDTVDTIQDTNEALNFYTALNLVSGTQNQYSIEAYMRMYVFLEPANPSAPVDDVFPFVCYNIRRTAMQYNSNQYFGFPLANNIISRFYFTALNKQNVLTFPEVGQCHSAALALTDLRIFLNGSFQIYAYPTAGTPLNVQHSIFAPNALVYASLVDDPVVFPYVCTGGLQEYIYDSAGNGQVFADVLVNYQMTLKTFKTGRSAYCRTNHVAFDAPFNPYNENTAMIQSANFQDLWCFVVYHNTENNESLYYTRGTLSFLQSPLYKYLYPVETSSDVDACVITKEVKTLIVDATASTVISAAPIAESMPSILNFNQCAGASPVFRVQEVSIAGTRVPSATVNTVTYRFLLPNSGTLGKMYLRFLPRWASDLYIPVGYGYYQTVTNLFVASEVASNSIYTKVNGDTNYVVASAANPLFSVPTATPITANSAKFTAISTAGLNTISYNDMLGSRTWMRAVRWILPLNLQLQFNFLQEDFFLKYYGANNKSLAIEQYWTQHVSDTYFISPCTEGFLTDFPFRQFGSVVPQHLSMFPFFLAKDLQAANERRDYSRGVMPICTIACNDLHESFTNMERICLSNEKQFVEFDFDQRLLSPGNCDAGLGYGLTNSSDAMRWRLGPLQTPNRQYAASPNGANLSGLNNFSVQNSLGFRRRQTFHFDIDDVTYPPTLLVQLVYMDGQTMETLLNDMKTAGVRHEYLTFDYQLRRLEQKSLLYPNLNNLDEINNSTILNIAGRNPTHIFLAHHPLMLRNNEYTMSENDPTLEENPGSGFLKELGIYPGYLGRRGGPLMISLPSAVHSFDLFQSSQQLVQTFNPTIDGSPLNPFNIGNNETNMINYALCTGQPLLQPANVVEVNAARRIKYFEMDPPLIGALAVGAWTFGPQNQFTYNNWYNTFYVEALNAGITDAVAGFDKGGPVCAYQYRGGNLLPSRFVVPIYISSQFWNGAILQVNATPFPITSRPLWNYTVGGVNPNTTDSDLLFYSNAIRHNPFYDCHFVVRKYAFAQRLSVAFTTTTAQLSFDYPSGGTIVA